MQKFNKIVMLLISFIVLISLSVNAVDWFNETVPNAIEWDTYVTAGALTTNFGGSNDLMLSRYPDNQYSFFKINFSAFNTSNLNNGTHGNNTYMCLTLQKYTYSSGPTNIEAWSFPDCYTSDGGRTYEYNLTYSNGASCYDIFGAPKLLTRFIDAYNFNNIENQTDCFPLSDMPLYWDNETLDYRIRALADGGVANTWNISSLDNSNITARPYIIQTIFNGTGEGCEEDWNPIWNNASCNGTNEWRFNYVEYVDDNSCNTYNDLPSDNGTYLFNETCRVTKFPADVISCYDYNELDGTTIIDRVNFRNGSTSGSPVLENSVAGKGLLLDGIDDKVTYGQSYFNSLDEFTIMALVSYTSGATNKRWVFGGVGDIVTQVGLGLVGDEESGWINNNGTQYQTKLLGGGGSYDSYLSQTYTFISDITTGRVNEHGYTASIYVNDSVEFSGYTSGGLNTSKYPAHYNSSYLLVSGVDKLTPAIDYFTGTIDEVIIFNRSINQSEIIDINADWFNNISCPMGYTCYENWTKTWYNESCNGTNDNAIILSYYVDEQECGTFFDMPEVNETWYNLTCCVEDWETNWENSTCADLINSTTPNTDCGCGYYIDSSYNILGSRPSSYCDSYPFNCMLLIQMGEPATIGYPDPYAPNTYWESSCSGYCPYIQYYDSYKYYLDSNLCNTTYTLNPDNGTTYYNETCSEYCVNTWVVNWNNETCNYYSDGTNTTSEKYYNYVGNCTGGCYLNSLPLDNGSVTLSFCDYADLKFSIITPIDSGKFPDTNLELLINVINGTPVDCHYYLNTYSKIQFDCNSTPLLNSLGRNELKVCGMADDNITICKEIKYYTDKIDKSLADFVPMLLLIGLALLFMVLGIKIMRILGVLSGIFFMVAGLFWLAISGIITLLFIMLGLFMLIYFAFIDK